MEEKRQLTCIVCPTGCALTVTLRDGQVVQVIGNECKRGAEYAVAECIHPVRTLTTTVRVAGTDLPLPVKSAAPLPKERLFDAMRIINDVIVKTPVKVGDTIVADIVGSGVDIVATRNG